MEGSVFDTENLVAPPEPEVLLPKRIPCPECGREFTTTQGMALHRIRTHNAKAKRPASARKRKPKATVDRPTAARILVGDEFLAEARKFRAKTKEQLKQTTHGAPRLWLFELLLALEPFTDGGK